MKKQVSKKLTLLWGFLFLCMTSYAQKITLKGKVTDSDGVPLQGVSVVIKGTSKGTVTSQGGAFELASASKGILVFRYVGFKATEVAFEGSNDAIAVQLQQDTETLSEVVVTALGVKRDKRTLTYSSQDVKGDELIKAKEPNIVNGLAGKVSGVQITSSSGAPGSSSRIVIRGATSVFGDNQALVVVDGVPINNDETGNLNSGPGSNRLVDIDPSIIESVNVLKGAAATSLYGSAGARGVLMITTKNGSGEKKPTVSFSADYSFENPLLPQTQTKYAQGSRGQYFDGEANKTSLSWGPLMDTLKINGVPAKRYDLQKLFFKTGITKNYTVGISGGSSTSNYYISYSNFNQEGSVPNTSFGRHAVFTKYTNKITKDLTSTFQFNYSNTSNDRMPEGYALENPIWTVLAGPVSWNPFPYLNPDGTQRVFRYSRNNPFWVLDNVYNKSTVNRFIPIMTFAYTPTSWLTVTERLGADIYGQQDKYKEAPSSTLATLGRIIEQNTTFRRFNHDLIISANKTFGDFEINGLLGNNVTSIYSQYHYMRGTGLNINGFDNIGSASTITASETNYLQRKVGFYAQANIEYKHFLALSLTGRYDGSSVLSKEKSFYPYSSIATSFIFSELLPSSLSSVISFGKLRLSYATVGNDGVGPYSLTTPYNSASIGNITFPFQGQTGFLLSSTLGNSNLKNETLNEYEIGLETKLFQNRIGLEASYFNRKTTDGIIPGVAIAPSTGYTGTTVNSASLENKGIEVLLNLTPIKTDKLKWDIAFNFTRIRNKVLSLYGDTKQLGNGFSQIIVGESYGVKYGARFKRTENGELLIDANGLPIRDEQDGIVGNISPDWLAGMNNTLRYKQFGLSFFFDMKKGGDIENNVDGYGAFYGTTKASEDRAPRVLKGISIVDNKPNTVPADMQTYYQNFGGMLESIIQDGTYIKLRSVSVNYDVHPKLLKKTPFKTASIIVSGRNLWIYSPHFTGADPEVSSFGSSNGSQGIYSFSAPTSRSINFTLKFTL
ncbi:SusC/RagA family TonB-linked outer membrane protein [Flectobacillus major]|jgi:TonB-linked SusC/RagA family outer membrane protein|uniref:SusC/RagA family TonB-linked outer membrane protein n=1 Tax=Flectobacillus major TaxID=103 RepID=UPI00040EFC5C|nr:SusC/RagA family TonB-linked outer membrane protein [Flectobacillus major]